jgi:hypothetical protein
MGSDDRRRRTWLRLPGSPSKAQLMMAFLLIIVVMNMWFIFWTAAPSTPLVGGMPLDFFGVEAVNHLTLNCGTCRKRLLILQTSDGKSAYSEMLDKTRGVMVGYATRWEYDYLRWDGTIRGKKQWQATYNRAYILTELLEKTDYEWVLFMDPGEVQGSTPL